MQQVGSLLRRAACCTIKKLAGMQQVGGFLKKCSFLYSEEISRYAASGWLIEEMRVATSMLHIKSEITQVVCILSISSVVSSGISYIKKNI